MKLNLKEVKYYNQLVEVLFKNTSAIWATNILAPLGISYLLNDFINELYLSTFVLLQFTLGFFRLYWGRKGLKSIKSNNQTLINTYLKLYLGVIFTTSTLFGILSVFVVFQAEQLQVFIMLTLIFGLISGSFATLSSVYHAIVLYIVPFMSMFFFALLFSSNSAYYLIAMILFIYLLVTIPSSYRMYLTLKTNIDKAKLIAKQKEELMINQAQLIHSAKMSSMGEMMANIAHQWRQPLSSISSIASSIKVTQSIGIPINSKELDKNMQIILSKSEYLSNTINTFHNFLKENKKIEKVSLQDRLDLILQIVTTSLKNNHIKIEHTNNLDPIYLYMVVGELDQVIINIINNSKDVLIEKQTLNPWIKLEVQTSKKEVSISIEDNAGGVPEEIINKIFEPYFSTKHQTQGTGLGLHMSYKIIVESLKGKLYVKNTKNGAKFFIKIPLA